MDFPEASGEKTGEGIKCRTGMQGERSHRTAAGMRTGPTSPFPASAFGLGTLICTIFARGADADVCYLELVKKANKFKKGIYS